MHKLRNILSVFVAYLLLFVFSTIQVTEVIHNHVEDHHVLSHADLKKQSSEITLADSVQKCKFCKDLSSQQIAFSPLEIATFDFAITGPSVAVIAASGHKLFDTAVNTWTNKGPPIS